MSFHPVPHIVITHAGIPGMFHRHLGLRLLNRFYRKLGQAHSLSLTIKRQCSLKRLPTNYRATVLTALQKVQVLWFSKRLPEHFAIFHRSALKHSNAANDSGKTANAKRQGCGKAVQYSMQLATRQNHQMLLIIDSNISASQSRCPGLSFCQALCVHVQ